MSFGENHMVVGIIVDKIASQMMGATAEAGPPQPPVTQLMVQFIDGPKAKETL